MTSYRPFRSSRWAPFRWQQEEVKEWPWQMTELVQIDEPLCFFFAPLPTGRLGAAAIQLCIKPIGHDNGDHEVATSLTIIEDFEEERVHMHVLDTGAFGPERVSSSVNFVYAVPSKVYRPTYRYVVSDEHPQPLHVFVPVVTSG